MPDDGPSPSEMGLTEKDLKGNAPENMRDAVQKTALRLARGNQPKGEDSLPPDKVEALREAAIRQNEAMEYDAKRRSGEFDVTIAGSVVDTSEVAGTTANRQAQAIRSAGANLPKSDRSSQGGDQQS